jgi:hypothetical protein
MCLSALKLLLKSVRREIQKNIGSQGVDLETPRDDLPPSTAIVGVLLQCRVDSSHQECHQLSVDKYHPVDVFAANKKR